VQTKSEKKYHFTFIDDCMRYCYINLLRSTNKALEMFICYKNKDENLFDKKIKVIKSDKGGEYKISFGEFFFQNIHQTTAHYSPK
jgi:hypothetical protein